VKTVLTIWLAMILFFPALPSGAEEAESQPVAASPTEEAESQPTTPQARARIEAPESQPTAPSRSTETQAAESQPSSDPEVDIRAPSSYTAKKFFLFPLALPGYVMRGVTYPIHELARLMERKKVVEWTSAYLTRKDWVIFPILQFGGGDGFGGGLAFRAKDMFGSGYNLTLDYTIFSDLDQRAGLRISSPTYYLADRPFHYRFQARFRDKTDARFYGLGADSLEENRSEYAYDRVRAGLEFDYEPLPGLTISSPFQILTDRATPDEDLDHPSVEQTFPLNQLVALNERVTFAIFGLQVAHDTRDAEINATRGGYRMVRFLRFQGLDSGRFNFNEIELDVRHYFKLWTPEHILALRNNWVFQQATGAGGVPFNLRAELDVNSPLRGFPTGRFRDAASVLFNFEYRYPIWDHLQGTLFVDTGKVFNGIEGFNFNDWRYSVGGGLRIFFKDFFIFRAQVGYGGEGAVFVFKVGENL